VRRNSHQAVSVFRGAGLYRMRRLRRTVASLMW
jgi:hypothetical protein